MSYPTNPHMYRRISAGSIMVKVPMNIVLTRLLFNESHLLTNQFDFCSRGVMMAYIPTNNSKKLHTSPLEKLYASFVDFTYDHIHKGFLLSMRSRFYYISGSEKNYICLQNRTYRIFSLNIWQVIVALYTWVHMMRPKIQSIFTLFINISCGIGCG